MNWNSFGIIGYLSVLLWVCVPLLWVLHHIKGNSSRWLCPIAVLVALIAFTFAKINSETHVNRIEPDRSEQVAEVQAREEAKRKAAEDDRGEDVADIRFAEDGSGDFLDKAGMDESDLKYMESIGQASEPDWKKNKKSRSSGSSEDGDLDSMLGGNKAIVGMESDPLADGKQPEPIVMKESEMALAHKLDGFNLTTTRTLFLLALVMMAIDYLRRANRYAIASHPLPLPSSWLNGLTPLPPVVVRPEPARRTIEAELEWLSKRGDSFVYVTDDWNAASGLPSSLPRIGKKTRPIDVLHVSDEITDEFIFEALWYGRCCFVVASAQRADRMMSRFLKLLEERKKVRAHVSQAAHIVWNAKQPLSEEKAQAFERLAKATGFSMLVCRDVANRNTGQTKREPILP